MATHIITTDPGEIFGPKLRELRKQRGMTLKELAEQAQISSSFLSEIERRQAAPSVGTIKRLAGALGVSMSTFFLDERPQDDLVVRADQRKVISHHIEGYDVSWAVLAPDGPKRMEPLMGLLLPGATTSKLAYTHEGEEWGYVIEGRLTLQVGGREILLEVGDSVYFVSELPHRLMNRGQPPCRYIWVSMPKPNVGRIKP